MSMWITSAIGHLRTTMRRWLLRIEVLAFFPIMTLLTHQFLGPDAVLVSSMVLPSLIALMNIGVPLPRALGFPPTDDAGILCRNGRDTMAAMLDRIALMPDADSACFILEIDEWDRLVGLCGAEAAEDFMDMCGRRLRAALRADDLIAQLGPGRFGVVLHPIAAARLGIRDSIADRMRAGLAAPVELGRSSIRMTACVGHAALRRLGAEASSGAIDGAEAALRLAQAAGPNMTRAFVPGQITRPRGAAPLSEEVDGALKNGAIRPWFQPQTDAQTGRPVGFEALARWQHPTLGLLGPGQFLDAVADAGQMATLGSVVRRSALAALSHWDDAGFGALTVSVNACSDELRDPEFAEQVSWDLDTANIAPERLIVEVLESVASETREDAILETLRTLRSRGVALDLDDFGVGQASLLSIRRFGIGRIKIDRSFVIGIDEDAERQVLVSGILSLARGMGLDVLAEGVETERERAMLTRMGCDVLQGFGIGKPMPLWETDAWLATYHAGRPASAGAPILLRPAN